MTATRPASGRDADGVGPGEAVNVEAAAGYALAVLLDVGLDLVGERRVSGYLRRSLGAHNVAAGRVRVEDEADARVTGDFSSF